MKIKAFFSFPENDDDFVRIGDNPRAYEEIIEEIAIIVSQLKLHHSFELYYDAKNVESFLEKADALIGGKYLASCRVQIQQLFRKFSQNISSAHLTKGECVYVSWNINCTVTNASRVFAEAAEAKHNEGEDKTVIVNVSSAYITNRDSIHVIKDAVHYDDLPLLIRVPIVNNEIEFSEWKNTLENSEFSLKDTKRFKTTPYKWKKQAIYIEITTGNYWYYDYFHKDNKQHFEVFNSTGEHLGEANTSGMLDESKADKDKRIDAIIQ